MKNIKLITIDAIPNATLQLLQNLEKFIRWHSASAQFYIAGGSVRKAYKGELLGKSDIDVFFRSQNDFKKVTDILNLIREGTLHPNCRHYSFSASDANSPFSSAEIEAADASLAHAKGYVQVQLIHSAFFDTVEDLMDNFDFTVCQMAYSRGKYFITEKALADDEDKVLRFAKDDYDQNRFKHQRLIKYGKNGYVPNMELYERVFLSPDALYCGDFCVNDTGEEYL